MHVQGFLFDELAEPVGFVPHVVASAPHAIVCMPDHDIEAKMAKAKAVLRWLLQHHRTAFSTSFGKDSSTVLGLAMSVAADLASEGLPVRDFCVLTSDTGVENPLISALADMEIANVRAWIKQHNLPGSVHVARPSLADQFPVMIIGGRCLPSMAGHKRDCTVSWKTTPLTRLRKRLLGRNQVAAGNYAVSVTGVRTDESATRARNLAQRAESDVALVQTNEEGNVALAPILGWSYDDVWEYLGLCRSGLEHTYSRFDRVIELYREAMGECVLGGSDSARTARPCSARTGCYVCLAVKEDKSMDQLVQEPHNQFMRPLAAFRTFLANTFHDLSRRTWVGRTIDAHGYIRFAPDGYSPGMLQDLLRYALTIDIEEREASAAVGIEPRFQIVSLEALFAIGAHWSLQGFARPFTALKIFREIEGGARFPIPDEPVYPKAVFPAERFIYVGEGWDGHRDSLLTGLRDPLSEAFRGEGCQGTRDIRRKGETLSIMDVSTADTLTIDPEGAMLFLDFEADEAIAEWNGAQHGKHRHGFSGIEYRRYVAYGLLSVAKGKEGQIDEILRRTAWRERMGLAGYNYDHERALGLSVAAEQRASQHGM